MDFRYLYGILLAVLIIITMSSHVSAETADEWNARGLVLARQGNDTAAIEAFDKAITLDPTFAFPWNNKGLVLARQGNDTAAIEAFDKAIALDPTFDIAKENRARALALLQRSPNSTNTSQGSQAASTTQAAGCPLLGLVALAIGCGRFLWRLEPGALVGWGKGDLTSTGRS
jgi:tetratricopeptide (TPR) repeat protein